MSAKNFARTFGAGGLIDDSSSATWRVLDTSTRPWTYRSGGGHATEPIRFPAQF